MKDFLDFSGNTGIYGSRDATREAFSKGLIADGEVWMDMINSRNKTSHTYNEETADEIFMKIMQEYFRAFEAFAHKMEAISNGEQGKNFEKMKYGLKQHTLGQEPKAKPPQLSY